MSYQTRRKTVEAFQFRGAAWPDWFCKCVMTGRIVIIPARGEIGEARCRLVLTPDLSRELTVGCWVVWEKNVLSGYTEGEFLETFEHSPSGVERGL